MDCSDVVKKVRGRMALVIILDEKGEISGKGSGFVYWKKNMLVTCNHVVSGGASIKIRFPGGQFLDAEVVMADLEHDLALLRFKGESEEPLEPADIASICEGMSVVFAGYPLSLFDLTTHQGILSAILKDATGTATYLIDGTVNGGNSGCPLLDSNGNVVGVVNAKRRERSDLLTKVEKLSMGAISIHGLDLVEVQQALIANVQLGIGYATPCSYIPKHSDPELVVPEKPTKQGKQ